MLYVLSFNKIVFLFLYCAYDFILCLCFYFLAIHSMLLEFYMVFMFFFNITCEVASNEEKDHPASNIDGNKLARDVESEIRRGITIMKSIIHARDKGIKFDVHWNEDKLLIETNGSILISYIGSLVRREVPITCDDWRKRELKPVKEKIWSDIQVPYVMSFVFVDDYLFKLLTHSIYVFS